MEVAGAAVLARLYVSSRLRANFLTMWLEFSRSCRIIATIVHAIVLKTLLPCQSVRQSKHGTLAREAFGGQWEMHGVWGGVQRLNPDARAGTYVFAQHKWHHENLTD